MLRYNKEIKSDRCRISSLPEFISITSHVGCRSEESTFPLCCIYQYYNLALNSKLSVYTEKGSIIPELDNFNGNQFVQVGGNHPS